MANEIRRVVRRAGERPTHPALVGVMAVLGAVLGQFAVELGAGKVPIPAGWEWTAPIAIAGLVAMVAYLPSPASRGRDPSGG